MTATPGFPVSASPPHGGSGTAPLPDPRRVEGGENADLTSPVDAIHAMCATAIVNIRRDHTDAKRRVGVEAARFQAEIDRICATGGRDGWDAARDLAGRETT